PSRLLITIHHLIVDGVSWRILLDDLQLLYRQLSQGRSIHLLPKTTSYRYWAERLLKKASTADLRQELNYWLFEPSRRVVPLPVDIEGGINNVGSSSAISVRLDEEESLALLQKAPSIYHTQINDILLTALLHVFTSWTGERSMLVDLE